MPDPDQELLQRAIARTPEDPDVRECWSFVVRGLELGWLDRDELRELIGYLRDGSDFGVEELMFERLGDRLRVRLLDDSAECEPGAMIGELSALVS